MKRNIGLKGFTSVELLIGSVVFGILATGVVGAFLSLQTTYEKARQLNEIYTVLSACPEIDRALEYNSLNENANCSPNNVFARESGAAGKRSYTPTLDVKLSTDPSLPLTDELRGIPDSKIVNVKVGFQGSNLKQMELRMLITRNGVGQQ